MKPLLRLERLDDRLTPSGGGTDGTAIGPQMPDPTAPPTPAIPPPPQNPYPTLGFPSYNGAFSQPWIGV